MKDIKALLTEVSLKIWESGVLEFEYTGVAFQIMKSLSDLEGLPPLFFVLKKDERLLALYKQQLLREEQMQ